MGRNFAGVEHLKPVHPEQMGEAADGIMAQMLVINGVVLQIVEQPDQVVRFRNEHAVGCEHFQDALDDGVYVLDMGKAIRRGDHLRGAVFLLHLASHFLREVALDGRDAALIGDLGHVGRFDAEDAVPTLLEVRDQRAVVRSDVDRQIVLAETEHLRGFGIEIRKVLAQDPGHAAGVGILRREDDDRIDRDAELHQLAVRTVHQVGREPGLLLLDCADRDHLVHRRHVAERQHGLQRLVTANLAALDRNASATTGAAGNFGWEHGKIS